MLTARNFTKEWIEARTKASGTRNATNLEKCIHALELVGRLAEGGLKFVFKGGTSLVLLLQPIRRLSIDVDILCLEPLERLHEALNAVTKGVPFTEWRHQGHRDAESPPTKHFQVFYRPVVDAEPQPHVQLDVLEAAAIHPKIESREIRTDFVEVEKPVSVAVPSIDCMLGDKLAAFAPQTIGVLYQPVSRRTGERIEPSPSRVMKQLFDVGELVNVATDLRIAAQTHRLIFEEQNRYRGGGFTLEQVLDDTLDAAYWLSQMGVAGEIANDKTEFLNRAVRSLDSHLFGSDFGFPRAKVAAGRAALVAALIKSGRVDQPLAELRRMPEDINELKKLHVAGPWAKLDALRKTNPEAFYYWHRASALLAQ